MPGLLWHLAVLVFLTVSPVAAQDQPQAAIGGFVILDQERLYVASEFGLRVQQEIDAAGQELATENRQIEQMLTEEELSLTELRDTISREEFAVLADEFDDRVEIIRAEQVTKGRILSSAADAARQQFFELALPILLELVNARGAVAIIDRRSVLLAADRVDITDAAIAAVNAQLGDGGDGPILDLSADALPDETQEP